MSETVLVDASGTQFLVEVSDVERLDASSLSAARPLRDVMSFDGVADTVAAVASSLAAAWESVRPDEATVEFGLKVTAKTGKLTGLLVEGGGDATLKVTMSWKSSSQPTGQQT